jgi:ABC-2 type transport system ATP-binding protein
VRGLTKSYGGVLALRGLDFTIARGEVFALLGPNGAGKTTTVEILEGYRKRDGGEVRVLGYDPGTERAAIKPRVGIVLQSTGVERYLTVAETVALHASYYPRTRPVQEVIELVGLQDESGTRVLHLSGGQQRRLDVAVALVGDPELLFLDEPTTGFDPSARREAWAVVKRLAALDKTVLLTTHYMEEAEQLADRVAVVAGGRIVAEGPPARLAGRDRRRARVRLQAPADVELPAALGARQVAGGEVEITADDLARTLYAVSGWALGHQLDLGSLQIVRPSLEDVYLELTGSGAAPEPAAAEAKRA